MFKFTSIAAFTIATLAGSAMSADPIIGNWRTQSGETASIAACDDGNFCVTLKTGAHAGTSIGKLANTDGRYKGKITDPATDKTYSGKASISGSTMKMSGCVLGGLICQSQTWNKK